MGLNLLPDNETKTFKCDIEKWPCNTKQTTTYTHTIHLTPQLRVCVHRGENKPLGAPFVPGLLGQRDWDARTRAPSPSLCVTHMHTHTNTNTHCEVSRIGWLEGGMYPSLPVNDNMSWQPLRTTESKSLSLFLFLSVPLHLTSSHCINPEPSSASACPLKSSLYEM